MKSPRKAATMAARPTKYLPGSKEKVAVLCLRAALSLPLFNPADAKLPRRARAGRAPLLPAEGITEEALQENYRMYLRTLQ